VPKSTALLLTPKGVNPVAIQVMAEDGIDISHHSSNPADEYTGICQSKPVRILTFKIRALAVLDLPEPKFFDGTAACGCPEELGRQDSIWRDIQFMKRRSSLVGND
jgi:hypothetical protein